MAHMPSFSKFTQYCAGRGYLDKKGFNAEAKELNTKARVNTDLVQNMLMAAGRTALQQAANQPMVGQSAPRFQNPTLIQRGIMLLMVPMRAAVQIARGMMKVARNVATTVRNVAANIGTQLNNVAAQVLGFFFGKRVNETDEAEKQKRTLSDATLKDALGEVKVEETHQSSMGR